MVKERLFSASSSQGLSMMTNKADGSIRVLVIEDGLAIRDASGSAIDFDEAIALSQSLDWPDLSFIKVGSSDEAADHLRSEGADALLVGGRNITGITFLLSSADDTPILAVAERHDIALAEKAIGAGAEDVLLTADLQDQDMLARRVQLAIARKASEREQKRQAREDAPTGLANSLLLEERFVRALARADRYATLVGLVAIDLDGFDALTRQHGQVTTDRLLQAVGERLLGEIRQTDTLARTRDHGFTWMVEGLPAIDDIDSLVNRLPNQLARPFSIEGQEIKVTASVGVAIAPFHGRDFKAANAMAEAAMIDVANISGDALLMLPIPRTTKPTRSTVDV